VPINRDSLYSFSDTRKSEIYSYIPFLPLSYFFKFYFSFWAIILYLSKRLCLLPYTECW